MKDNLESAPFPPWLLPRSAHPLLPAQCPQPHLTWGGRGGGSRASAQRQASDGLDPLPSCPQSRPAYPGACGAFAFSDPGLRGCQFPGAGVRVASFQKLGELDGQRVWAGEACSWGSFFQFFPFLQRRSKLRGARGSSPRADSLQVRGGARRWHRAAETPRRLHSSGLLRSPGQRARLPGLADATDAAPGSLRVA